MYGRAALLVAVSAAVVSGAVVWLVGTKEIASPPISAQHEPTAPDGQLDAILDRLDQIESRVSALEAERGDSDAPVPAAGADALAASALLDGSEFIEQHREDVFALIDESRMAQAWKERQKELFGWTQDLEFEFDLADRSIGAFLVREYRPLFEHQWKWRDRDDYSAAVDSPELDEARRHFRATLHAAYPAPLADRLFLSFGWERQDVLNRGVSDEQILRFLEGFR